MNNKSLLSNIPKLYIIKLAKWFMLTMPIIVLFLQENKLNMQDVFTLKAIYSIAIITLEIPSGYFADILGRKFTLVAGSIISFLGFVIYALSSSFELFVCAEITLGIGQSFISGSDSALLYDSLKAENKEKDFMKLEGRIMSLGNFAEAAAGILGGLIATISLRTPFYCQIAIAATAIPASLLLIEPHTVIHKSKSSFKNILNILKNTLIENKILKWNIFLSAVIGSATLSMAWFIQAYFRNLDFSLSTIGYLWTALNLTVGFVAIFAYRLEKYLGKTKTIIFIIIGISSNILLSAIAQSSILIITFLFFFYAIRGIATPILKEYINRITDSNERATVLSIRNFIIRICFTIIGPFLGWYSDLISIKAALSVMSVMIFILASTCFIFIYKSEKI